MKESCLKRERREYVRGARKNDGAGDVLARREKILLFLMIVLMGTECMQCYLEI